MHPHWPSFANRRAALATMHGKEAAIGPPFKRLLGLEIDIPSGLNTDELGTFSGEVERRGSMEEVLLAKATLGLERSGLDLALASEGSFGPHPHIPFVAAGLEKLVLLDRLTGLVAIEQHVDLNPSFANWEANCFADIEPRVRAKGFPEQAMIVRPNTNYDLIFKGLNVADQLAEAILNAATHSADGLAFIQTDMRAHMNPRRMQALETLAEKLAQRLCHHCPACRAPGWGMKRQLKGLPCAACGGPTSWVRFDILGCYICAHEDRLPRPDGLEAADPTFCPICNP